MPEQKESTLKTEELSDEAKRVKTYYEDLLNRYLYGEQEGADASALANLPTVSAESRALSPTAQTSGGQFASAFTDFLKGVGIGQGKKRLSAEDVKLAQALLKTPEKTTETEKTIIKPEPTPEELKAKEQKASKSVTDEYIKLYSSFDSSHPLIKQVDTAINQFEQMKGLLSNPSGPNDLATIYTYMKALDPTSVVRESEFKSASEATGAWNAVKVLGPKIARGEKLSPEARQQFMDSALIIANTWIGARNKLRTKFSEHTGGNAEYVMRKFGEKPEAYYDRVILPLTSTKTGNKADDFLQEMGAK